MGKNDDNEDESNGGNGSDGEEKDADDDFDEDESEETDTDGDNNGMYKDKEKTLAKLNEKLAEAQKEIDEKKAEGVDVTAAQARLNEAQVKLAAVGAAFDGNDLEMVKHN